MTPEETSLARSLVALPGWRWVPGMLVCAPDDRGHVTAVLDGDEGVTVYVCFDEETRSCRFDEEIGLLLPDLTHMGTAGILLGMLAAIAPPEVYFGVGAVRVTWSDTGSADGPCLGVAVARALVAVGNITSKTNHNTARSGHSPSEAP